MTFPNFPKRSSSDDELDQALNAWAKSHAGFAEESPRGAQLNSTTTDALEFHRWADEALRTEPAATGPAAGTWNRILRGTAQEKEGGGNMSSVTISQEPRSAIIQDVPKASRQAIVQYLNYAASLLIVFGVAFAGAFMAMQINQPGGSNGRYAMLGQLDSESCNVEPMTVDEALASIEDPFNDSHVEEPYLTSHIDLQRRWVMVASGGPVVPHNYVDRTLVDSFQDVPHEESFGIASDLVSGFLACGQNGTVGQMFQFLRPFEIRRIVLTGLPVYLDQETVRSELEELMPVPATDLLASSDSAFANPEYVFSANPTIGDAASLWSAYQYGMGESILIGVTVTDQNGVVVFQNDYRGHSNPAGPLKTTDRMRVIVGKSLVDGEWYVLAVIPE